MPTTQNSGRSATYWIFTPYPALWRHWNEILSKINVSNLTEITEEMKSEALGVVID